MTFEQGIIPVIERPTPNVAVLMKAALDDEVVHELFEQASPEDGVVIPEAKFAFLSHVAAMGLSDLEADEVFFRKEVRRLNSDAQ